MSRLYTGKIKVVDEDNWCFPVDRNTLLRLGAGGYEDTPFTDPFPVENISYNEWVDRKQKQLAALLRTRAEEEQIKK